jgi:anhydro-N-acetylmuramic acid kinase
MFHSAIPRNGGIAFFLLQVQRGKARQCIFPLRNRDAQNTPGEDAHMNIRTQLQKKKKRNFLLLSAASPHHGLQCLSLHCEKDSWDILGYQLMPYPQRIRDLHAAIVEEDTPSSFLETLAHLDKLLSQFYVDCSRELMGTIPRTYHKFHLGILHRLAIWNGTIRGPEPSAWDLSSGDPQLLADEFKVPIMTGFARRHILAGGEGLLPILAGNMRIADRTRGPLAVFLNLGKLAHLTVVDRPNRRVIMAENIGPGTLLLDAVANEAGHEQAFDRDGAGASKGKVDEECLSQLSTKKGIARWLVGEEQSRMVYEILATPRLRSLQLNDKLATVSALTARLLSSAYWESCRNVEKPAAVWVSGGGAHNLALLDFLGRYFSPVPMQTIDAIGVPVDALVPVALGLSIDAWIGNYAAHRAVRDRMPTGRPGRWVV